MRYFSHKNIKYFIFFPSPTRLRGLRLAGNRLSSVGEHSFRGAPSIRMLNLADNEIKEVHQDAFTPIKRLKVGKMMFFGEKEELFSNKMWE